MTSSSTRGRGGSVRAIFSAYAVVSLVPVLLLGAALMLMLNSQEDARGLAEGRSEAQLIGRTVITPLLGNRDITDLTADERGGLRRSVSTAISSRQVLRLRLRSLDGTIVFSSDSSRGSADDEALEAAKGETVAHLSWLNSDGDRTAPRGARVVEIYEPVQADDSSTQIGVLEMYLPYAPIAADISSGQRRVGIALSGGLVLLWLCLLGVSMSVTKRLRQKVTENAVLASHDSLTGLLNRTTFTQRAAIAISAANAERPTAIALIDLDRFKDINDTLGHDNGDELLVMLAQRLASHMRDGDAVARLGGDEFGLILRNLRSAGEAVEVLDRLRAVLRAHLRVSGLPLAVEASVGFALAPQDGIDIGQLMQRADVAMYVAKKQHLGVARYQESQDNHDSATLALIAELGTAIAENQLVLHYQAKGDLHLAEVCSVEALVRWRHPTRGLLYPDSFIPAAEQTELIEELTHWVLRAATHQLSKMTAYPHLSVAVNVSAGNLVRPDFAATVLSILRETDTDPRRVIIEVTETSLMTDPRRAAATLHALRDSGLGVSIDDFGAGQTSLSYLATLPISELKIDKAFVLSMLADERNFAIVHSVIELGHSLGFTVTAEGVETADILEQLSVIGCDTAQGYLLARPVAAEDLPGSLINARTALLARKTTLV